MLDETLLEGVYFRMERRRPADKYRNRMNLEIRGHVLTLRIPRDWRHTPIDLEMRDVAVTQDSFNLDWTPHNTEWGQTTFWLVEHHGMMGLMENDQHFWKYQAGESLSDAEEVWDVVDETPASAHEQR